MSSKLNNETENEAQQQDVFLDSENALFPFVDCRVTKVFNTYVKSDEPIPRVIIHIWHMPSGMSLMFSLKKYLACVKHKKLLSKNERTFGTRFSDLQATSMNRHRGAPPECAKTIEEFFTQYSDTKQMSLITKFVSPLSLMPGICDFCDLSFKVETLKNGTLSGTIYPDLISLNMDMHPLITIEFYANGQIKRGPDRKKLIDTLISVSTKFKKYYESVERNRKVCIGIGRRHSFENRIPFDDYSTGPQVEYGDSLPHVPVTMSFVDKSLKAIEGIRISVKESMPEPTSTPATPESTETQLDSSDQTSSITEPTIDQIIAAASRKSYSELTELVNALVQLHDKRRAMRDANLATIKRLEEEASHIPKLVALINDRETRMKIGSELFAAARRALVSVGG